METICSSQALKLPLPKEHGSWSLALEPVVFGLLVAPSKAGGALAVAAAAGFFLRRPVKLAFATQDLRRPQAITWTAILALIGLTGLSLAGRWGAPGGLWPLFPAALAGALFALFDSRNGSRESAAELAGTVAFALVPAAFGSLTGWSPVAALALAVTMLTRSVSTVLTVRTLLRIRKGKPFSVTPALAAVLAGTGLIAWLASLRFAPWLALIFALLLVVRTFWLLLWRPPLTARTIGILEMVLGIVMVLTLSLVWENTLGW